MTNPSPTRRNGASEGRLPRLSLPRLGKQPFQGLPEFAAAIPTRHHCHLRHSRLLCCRPRDPLHRQQIRFSTARPRQRAPVQQTRLAGPFLNRRVETSSTSIITISMALKHPSRTTATASLEIIQSEAIRAIASSPPIARRPSLCARTRWSRATCSGPVLRTRSTLSARRMSATAISPHRLPHRRRRRLRRRRLPRRPRRRPQRRVPLTWPRATLKFPPRLKRSLPAEQIHSATCAQTKRPAQTARANPTPPWDSIGIRTRTGFQH